MVLRLLPSLVTARWIRPCRVAAFPGHYLPFLSAGSGLLGCRERMKRSCINLLIVTATLAAGCARFASAPMPPMTPPMVGFGPAVPAYNPPQIVPTVARGIPNPIPVPVTDRDVAWDNIVDVVDDYFKIEREDRVQLVGDILTEGQIETFPQTGATLLEPWRGDSANAYERLESTLQSIRRTALVRVIPDAGGYLVDVTVLKELEDVERPMYATTGAAVFRHDNTFDRNTEAEPSLARQVGDQPRPVANPRQTAGWIGKGRDGALEQELLARIHDRLTHGPLVTRPVPAPVIPGQGVPILAAPVVGPAAPGSAVVLPPAASDVGLPPSNRP